MPKIQILAVRPYWLSRRLWEAQALLISKNIEAGTFDYLKWFPHGNKANLFVQEQEKARTKAEPKTIRQYYNEWKVDRVPPLVKKTRGRKHRSHLDAHIQPHPRRPVPTPLRRHSNSGDRTELIEKRRLSVKMAKNVINATLRALFRDAKAEGLIENTPFRRSPKEMVAAR